MSVVALAAATMTATAMTVPTSVATVPGSTAGAPAIPGLTFRPGLLVQTWLAGSEAGQPHATLRLRRLELQARGELPGGALRYGLMAELGQFLEPLPLDGTPLPGSGSLLKQDSNAAALIKDLHATVRTPLADIQAGQAKIPVSLDGITSSGNLLLPERAAVSTEFGYKRDLGVQAIRSFGPLKVTAGLFARQTIADVAAPAGRAAVPRDAALRVDLAPFSGLQVGAVAYGTVIGRGVPGTRDRGELDMRWEPGPIVLQGELIQGADVDAGGGQRRRSQGAYATAGYRLTEQIQPVVRVGYLDRDLDQVVGSTKPVTQLDLGLNLATPLAGTRIQAAYSLTWPGSPSPVQGAVLVGQYRY